MIEAQKIATELMSKHGLIDKGWRFEFNSRKRSLGVCSHSTKKILLSKHFIPLISLSDLKNTILHEIAHALVGVNHGHDYVWRIKAIEIGCNGNRLYKGEVKIEGKYKAVCPVCGKVVYKHRKPTRSYSCGSCSDKFDVRFKLDFHVN